MAMAQLLSSATYAPGTTSLLSVVPLRNPNHRLVFSQEKCRLRPGRVSCLFSDARKKEEARRALENALSQKKDEFEKWNKQIDKRVQIRGGGGGGSGGTGKRGWFGGGGWRGWFEGDGFWDKATQTLIAIFAIGSLYLLVAKGEAISSAVSNSLLGILQKIRKTLDQLFSGTTTTQSERVPVPVSVSEKVNSSYQTPTSAKERVIRKWGMD